MSPRPLDGGPLLLLIDDDPSVSTLLRPLLEEAGYRLVTALTGREGLALAQRERFNLIIVDIMLPDLSGFDVVDALAADDRTREAPVIVLTAADLSEADRARLKKHAQALAAKGDLTKDALLAAIRRVSRPREVPPSPAPAATVLLVDDHDVSLELGRTLLDRMGVRVLVARDGESAVTIARREQPALVLMDLAMPKKDGYAACRELKSDPATRAIPIVALTALTMRSDEEKARAAGFDGYLSKPIERVTLERAVAPFLKKG